MALLVNRMDPIRTLALFALLCIECAPTTATPFDLRGLLRQSSRVHGLVEKHGHLATEKWGQDYLTFHLAYYYEREKAHAQTLSRPAANAAGMELARGAVFSADHVGVNCYLYVNHKWVAVWHG